ncbi:MAG: deoxyguanosinetriphosphate triphosphohydrolase [Proteobacteria bacterium]|nr:MAG: deoxyguanosinetriphosphate triphosphohydrolase [Pseudomonadota bacterium]
MTAPYAASAETSLGRMYPEPRPVYRTEYQRDRDRIIHCTGFRRLEYKTQVFVNHEGDLYRTRLTHSIEVAQIARSVARTLGLNEDLTEAMALAHDLGHTPFGHAGQDALNACMKPFGGFEHNLQSLRVVDLLETKYAEFPGLNLTFETREGILKHCSVKNAKTLGDVAKRFLDKTQPSLEAQLTNIADQIAYNNHDIDDGVRSGLISVGQLCETQLFAVHFDQVKQKYPELDETRSIHETIRRMIGAQVVDLVETSRAHIKAANIRHVDEVRAHPGALIRFSDEMFTQSRLMKKFLRENLYSHHKVYRMTRRAHLIIESLFDAFLNDLCLLPSEHQTYAKEARQSGGEAGYARVVADYIAGMTDRFAIKEYDRLFTR